MSNRLILFDLVAAVQERPRGSVSDWHTVAAFDLIVTAEAYAEQANTTRPSHEFRVVRLEAQ